MKNSLKVRCFGDQTAIWLLSTKCQSINSPSETFPWFYNISQSTSTAFFNAYQRPI